MESCHFCKSAISSRYYRVGSEMACSDCVAKESAHEKAAKWIYFQRGLLFAVLAAMLALLLKWGVEAALSLADSTSLFSLGAWVRGGVTLLIGAIIGGAAKAGAKNRSCRELQVCAMVLTYLAYTMAIVPIVLSQMPAAKIHAGFVIGVILIAPFSPFLAILKNPVAISGLIVLGFALKNVWVATATPPEATVDGPFDLADTYAEKPMFGSLPTN